MRAIALVLALASVAAAGDPPGPLDARAALRDLREQLELRLVLRVREAVSGAEQKAALEEAAKRIEARLAELRDGELAAAVPEKARGVVTAAADTWKKQQQIKPRRSTKPRAEESPEERAERIGADAREIQAIGAGLEIARLQLTKGEELCLEAGRSAAGAQQSGLDRLDDALVWLRGGLYRRAVGLEVPLGEQLAGAKEAVSRFHGRERTPREGEAPMAARKPLSALRRALEGLDRLTDDLTGVEWLSFAAPETLAKLDEAWTKVEKARAEVDAALPPELRRTAGGAR